MALQYNDNPVPDEMQEPILNIVSVAPIKQPVRLNDSIHWLLPLEAYGLVTRNEAARDWRYYKVCQDRIAAGETLTNDEAIRGDLACDRMLRLALPSLTEEEWEGIAASDKLQLLDFFFEISNLTEAKREEARKRQPMRSISVRSLPNSPGSTVPDRTPAYGGTPEPQPR